MQRRVEASRHAGGQQIVAKLGVSISERLQAIEELATYARVTTGEQPDGSVNVHFAGHTLVEGGDARTLSAVEDPVTGNMSVEISHGTTTLNITGNLGSVGSLGAAIETRDVTVPGLLADLDDLAFTVANQVIPTSVSDQLLLVVALSMLLTPILFILYDRVIVPRMVQDEEREDIDTLGGLVITTAGYVPVRGEVVVHESGLEFEVLDFELLDFKLLDFEVLDFEVLNFEVLDFRVLDFEVLDI